MPNRVQVGDIKKQLETWAREGTIVGLHFSTEALSLSLFGFVNYEKTDLSFEVRTSDPAHILGYFHSPRLSDFNMFTLGPDPQLNNSVCMTLENRRLWRTQMALVLAETKQPLTVHEAQAVREAIATGQVH